MKRTIPQIGAWSYHRLAEKIGSRTASALKVISKIEKWNDKIKALECLRGLLVKYSPLEVCSKCKNVGWCQDEREWDACRSISTLNYTPDPMPPCFGKGYDKCTPKKMIDYGCDRVPWLSFKGGCQTASMHHIPKLPSPRHLAEERKLHKRSRQRR